MLVDGRKIPYPHQGHALPSSRSTNLSGMPFDMTRPVSEPYALPYWLTGLSTSCKKCLETAQRSLVSSLEVRGLKAVIIVGIETLLQVFACISNSQVHFISVK